MNIKSLKELTPGQIVTVYNRQFNATNKAAYVRGDATTLSRDIGYFKFTRNDAMPEFAVYGHEIAMGMYVITAGKLHVSPGEKYWQTFKLEFGGLCQRFGGAFHAGDSIGAGSAYHIPTTYGMLCAAIHDDDKYQERRRGVSKRQAIFLRFRDYTGPDDFPLSGSFNQCSHKWNIHRSAPTLAEARAAALDELERRLAKLAEIAKPVPLQISDLYSELISAVNRGDIHGAQQLAARIAA